MSRPIGSKNKIKVPNSISNDGSPFFRGDASISYVEKALEKKHYDVILAVRCLRNGQFKGLWELVELDDDFNVKKVLNDANSKGMIMTMIARRVLRIVIAS